MAFNLPVEITHDIFFRLPAETIIECKWVCKTWNKLLSRDIIKQFEKIRLHQQQLCVDNGGAAASGKVTQGFIFLINSKDISGHRLYFGNYDENGGNDQNPTQMINHPLIKTTLKCDTNMLVGSCDGLMCLAETSRKIECRDPVHICNPITRECLQLGKFNEHNEYPGANKIYSGFGYDSVANKYKVVRIIWVGLAGYIQVYTLGSGDGWRNVGKTPNWFSSFYGVFANGALHWVDIRIKEYKIWAFNLSDEKFHVLPSESAFYFPHYDSRSFSFLRSCRGDRLYAIGERNKYDIGERNKCLDIWSFKKTAEGSTNRTTAASTSNEYNSWSWCMEFSITPADQQPAPWRYSPVALTKSGSVVLKCLSELYCYNPKTSTLRSLGHLNLLEAIPHTNSFVSLEDLGETTCKRRETTCKRRKTTAVKRT